MEFDGFSFVHYLLIYGILCYILPLLWGMALLNETVPLEQMLSLLVMAL